MRIGPTVTYHVSLGIGYLLAALMCVVAWSDHRGRTNGDERRPPSTFWLVAGLLLAAMGVARATNLANSAGNAARQLAEADGWYDDRRPAQLVVVVALAALWIWVGLFVHRHRDHGRKSRGPMTMTIILASLLVLGSVRTVSFHYSDSLLNRTRLLDTSLGNLLEVAGVGLAIVVALGEARSSRAPRPD